jgi:hypothetical protein
MRIRFAGYLAMGVVSAFLIVAYYAFVTDTFWWIALIGGLVLALLGVAELVMSRSPAALAIAAAAFSVLGLTEHELVIERDIDHGGMPAAR